MPEPNDIRKLHSKIVEWKYFDDSAAVHILIYLIAKARLKPTSFMGHSINRGEVVLGRNAISKATGIKEHIVRTRMKWFKDDGEISMRKISTEERNYGVIKLLNFSKYQKGDMPREPTDYQKKLAEAKRQPYSKPFEQWWAVCKKGGKGAAWFGWTEATDKPDVEVLIEKWGQYVEYCTSMNRALIDGQGWLRQRYFDSEWTHDSQGTTPEGEESNVTFGI